MTLLPRAYLTPVFDSDDPIIGREMYLRPSLWAVVFGHLGLLTNSWAWRQSEDPTGATVKDVTAEIEAELLRLEFTHMYIGEIREFARETPPDGWLRCNGATYANEDYPELAAVINIGLVVDDDHFRVPDRDRRLGMDGVTVGMQGGEEEHALTSVENAEHEHDYWTALYFDFLVTAPGEAGVWAGGIPATTDPGGEGVPHNNMQPYEGTQFFIRAAWPTAEA